MKFQQEVYVLLISLLALTQIIRANYLENTFEITSSKNSNICKSQFDGTILPHTTDCQKFYVCVNHKPQEYDCDPNFHFDENRLSCVAGSECGITISPPPSCIKGTFNAVEDDCYSFETCVSGKLKKIKCPANYYFHVPQALCVPVVLNAQFKCSCILPEHTVLANENNCETYFVCKKQTSVLEKCAPGQYYNSTINTCILDAEGICLTEPTKPPTIKVEEAKIEDDTTDVRELCARLGVKKIQFQTFAQGCNKFFICVNGILHTQRCPQGFYYDSNTKYCVVDMDNKCTDQEVQAVKQIKQEEYSKNTAEIVPKIPEDDSLQHLEETIAKTKEFVQKTDSFAKTPELFILSLYSQQQDKLFSKFLKL